MRIKRKETIAGVPALQVRDFFVYLFSYQTENFTEKYLGNYLGVDEYTANLLVNELIDRKFVEKRGEYYILTLSGTAFRNARCVPPIKREKADKILAEFIQRVQLINEDDAYLYSVSKIVLFGSYIDEKAEDLGDIDIAIELTKKGNDPEEFARLNDEAVKKAQSKGKSFSSIVEELFYTRNLVLLRLKNRNRYISLHEMTDGILQQTKTKQIFP